MKHSAPSTEDTLASLSLERIIYGNLNNWKTVIEECVLDKEKRIRLKQFVVKELTRIEEQLLSYQEQNDKNTSYQNVSSSFTKIVSSHQQKPLLKENNPQLLKKCLEGFALLSALLNYFFEEN